MAATHAAGLLSSSSWPCEMRITIEGKLERKEVFRDLLRKDDLKS
jgi:hypothetical protein